MSGYDFRKGHGAGKIKVFSSRVTPYWCVHVTWMAHEQRSFVRQPFLVWGAVGALFRWLDREQVGDRHHCVVAAKRLLDCAVDLAELRHERNRHSVLQSVAALARADDH